MIIDNNKMVYDNLQYYAEKDPNREALIFKDEIMTYGELNEKANRVANMLISYGIGKNDIVGIIMKRSFEMLITIFGILKSGAAYLPIDPAHPQERVDYYIENSKLKMIITKDVNCEYKMDGVNCFDWDNADKLSDFSCERPLICPDENDLAYIIYTSGSTGNPNGVMVRHKSLKNRLLWHINKFKMDEKEVVLQKTSYAFDVSVWELICWSIVGGKLVIIDPGSEKNPRKISKLIEKYKITMLHFVPSVLELFIEYIEYKFDITRIASVKNVIASGEELTAKTVQRFNNIIKPNNTNLWNLYGPTEATIDVTFFDCSMISDSDTQVPIGYAVDNVNLYVLDENLKKCSVNQEGELYIGGIAPASGYINNPELTNQRFIVNPYDENEIIYKSGDKVYFNEKDQLMYCGRFDFQVKLRGLRIELGEIERALLNIEEINKAVVLIDNRVQENKYLLAFYHSNKEIDEEFIISELKKKLPEYMVPNRFIYLDEVPVTVNGKIDRKQLIESCN